MTDPLAAQMVALRPYLSTVALRLCRDAERAQDLVSDAIARGWAARASFEPGTNLKGWLNRILRNSFINDRRRRRCDTVDIDGWDPGRPATQEDWVHLRDVEAALATLPPHQSAALMAVVFLGSYEDAAEGMGVTVDTIKSRVARARARLREMTL